MFPVLLILFIFTHPLYFSNPPPPPLAGSILQNIHPCKQLHNLTENTFIHCKLHLILFLVLDWQHTTSAVGSRFSRQCQQWWRRGHSELSPPAPAAGSTTRTRYTCHNQHSRTSSSWGRGAGLGTGYQWWPRWLDRRPAAVISWVGVSVGGGHQRSTGFSQRQVFSGI